jgi:tetratricopeptide (TPR) repeat protein
MTELSAEMADRLVKQVRRKAKNGKDVRRFDVSTSTITSHLVKPAASFLREGRFTEARALFEAILQTDPESADANNNLGFCLLPENPQLALKYFDETERLTGARGDLLAANRMLALAKLGEVTAALDIADVAFGLAMSSIQDKNVKLAPGVGSYVWNIASVLTGTSPQLDEVGDLRSYAVEILRAIESEIV